MRPRLALSILLLVGSTAASAATLTEVAGPWYTASPTFYGGANSGTYYFPSVIQLNGYVFVFAQGGQFSAATTPSTVKGTFEPGVPYCQGDKITLWRAPLTTAGIQSPFTQIRRVSRCDSNPYIVHWGPAGAFLAGASGPVYILAERQKKSNPDEVSLWWYRGVLGSDSEGKPDFTTWTMTKLFDVAPTVGRVGCCAMAFDRTRPAAPPGRIYTRGYGIRNHSLFEARFEFSTANQNFVATEIWSGGAWRPVENGLLDFLPDNIMPQVRANNIVKRDGALELWGSVIYPTSPSTCPCQAQNSAQNVWFTIQGNELGGNWTLVGPNYVTAAPAAVRCMPAGPAAIRNSGDILTFKGATYLFSEQNWQGIDPVDSAQPCPPDPFVGMDSVVTKIAPTQSLIVDDATRYFTVTPCRVFDSRETLQPLQSGLERTVEVAGKCGVSANARAISANLTVTQPTGGGDVRSYPFAGEPTSTSVNSFNASSTRAAMAVLPLSITGDYTGTLALQAQVAGGGTVHVILDVSGYFE